MKRRSKRFFAAFSRPVHLWMKLKLPVRRMLMWHLYGRRPFATIGRSRLARGFPLLYRDLVERSSDFAIGLIRIFLRPICVAFFNRGTWHSVRTQKALQLDRQLGCWRAPEPGGDVQ